MAASLSGGATPGDWGRGAGAACFRGRPGGVRFRGSLSVVAVGWERLDLEATCWGLIWGEEVRESVREGQQRGKISQASVMCFLFVSTGNGVEESALKSSTS